MAGLDHIVGTPGPDHGRIISLTDQCLVFFFFSYVLYVCLPMGLDHNTMCLHVFLCLCAGVRLRFAGHVHMGFVFVLREKGHIVHIIKTDKRHETGGERGR